MTEPEEDEFSPELKRLHSFFEGRGDEAESDPEERSEAVLARARRTHSLRSTLSMAIGRMGSGLMGLVQTLFLLFIRGTGTHDERIRRRVRRAALESDSQPPPPTKPSNS